MAADDIRRGREAGARTTTPGDVIEVELVEVTAAASARRRPRTPTGGSPLPPPRRGRWIAGGVLLVAAAGTTVALTAGDDNPSASPAVTSLDPSGITTPPTLGELVTIPPATLPGSAGTPGRGSIPGYDAPDATFAGDAPFDPTTITLPDFAPVPDVDPATLADYDLLAAAAANAATDTPVRTTLTLDGVEVDGLFSSTADVTATNDPAAGRDELIVDRGTSGVVRFVADRLGGALYRELDAQAGRWGAVPPDRFIEGTGATSLDELFDAFATGPITPATLAVADIEAGDGLVRIDGGVPAREYTIRVPVDALRPYGLLLVANVSEDTVADGDVPPEIEFHAYVSERSRLALVTSTFDADGTRFLLQQFFDRRPASVIIDLPTPEQLTPATTAPAPPATSGSTGAP